MMNRSWAFILVLCFTLTALAACAHAQSGVTLKYKFTPNELLRYNVAMTANISIDMNIPGADQVPGIPVSMSGIMRQRTKRILPNGDAELAVAWESISMKASGSPIQLDAKTMPVITMVMSPAGEVKSAKGMEQMSVAFGGMPFQDMGSLVRNSAFPSKPLNVGDVWKQAVPFPLGGNLNVQAKLTGVENGTAKVQQIISGDVNISSPIAGALDATMAKAKGNVALDGGMYFSIPDGRMTYSESNGKIEFALTADDTDGDMKAVVQMNASMELISVGK